MAMNGSVRVYGLGLVGRHRHGVWWSGMKTGLILLVAALAEIGGCFAFWAWLRLGRTFLWILPGCCSLLLFACLLTLVDTPLAGRAYAAYGGIYIGVAVLWMWFVEGAPPDRWDLAGAGLCMLGTAVILFAPHS